MTRFLLNREEVVLCESRADVTVLEYLRDHRQKCGTKEGCASGDCGACTVVVAAVENDDLAYRAINSCITFVGALHGKQLITVEDLAGDDNPRDNPHGKRHDELHPVQQAMVDQHGSQCGFCTPGFVMSLFALYKNPPGESQQAVSRQRIEEFLGGNLCRCTGYRPIIDAAVQAMRNAGADKFSARAGECAERLKAILKKGAAAPTGTSCFHLPESTRQLAALLRQYPDARLLAGGTDLALAVTQQLKSFDDIIFLGNVAELRAIKTTPGKTNKTTATTRHNEAGGEAGDSMGDEAGHAPGAGAALEIGAAVPLAECGDLLCAEYPGLAELLRRFGSAQVRNQATLGGNIANASPVADLPPALIAVGAELVLQRGERTRRMKIENYFIDYRKTALAAGEFIRSIIVPRAKPGSRAHAHQVLAYKVSKRFDDDISAVCAVFNVTLNGKRIEAVRAGFGGMAAIPKRARHCEQALLGQPLDRRTLENAKQALTGDFQPISDARAGAAYRMTVSQNLLQRLFLELPVERPGRKIQARISAYPAHAATA